MSFLLLATAAAVAAGAAGFFVARRPRSTKEEDAPAPPLTVAAAAPRGLERLPITLGDVVSIDTPQAREERWLEGVLVAREGDEIVAALFVAPEGNAEKAVVAFAPPRRQIGWLSPVSATALASSGAELPSTLEIAGVPMRRRARLPVTLERAGKGAPSIADRAIWAEYEATGRAVAIVIRGGSEHWVWTGTLCDPGEYERMGSGHAS